METKPKVSVLIITFNHRQFILEAVESALNQTTNFDYEIIITDDFSTDGTREIVLKLQKQYPEKIRLLLAKRNFNSNSFFVRGIKECEGQYIALLEGDDYWTSPLKLQKQVDFLDKNPECSICFHDVTRLYQDGSRNSVATKCVYQKQMMSIEDLLKDNFCYTCTSMFRNGLICNFPESYCNDLVRCGDYPFWVFYAEVGKIGYICENMGVYRINSGGIWSSQNRIKKLLLALETNEYLDNYLNFKYQKIIGCKISFINYRLAIEYEKTGDLQAALKYVRKSLETPMRFRYSTKASIKKLIKIWLRLVIEEFMKPQPSS